MRCTMKIVTRPITTLRTATFVVTLIAASLLPMLSNPSIAQADSVVQAGTAWLSGGGVDIMSGGDSSHNCVSVAGAPGQSQCNNTAGQVYAGDKWQCVEMINRLYLAKGWTSTTWWGNGNSLINDLPNHLSLTDQLQDHISYVNSGDVVTETHSTDGHAGVINSIDDNGTIHIKSQNADLDSQASITSGSLAAGTAHYALSGWVGYSIQAIVHHPTSTPTTDYSLAFARYDATLDRPKLSAPWDTIAYYQAGDVSIAGNYVAWVNSQGGYYRQATVFISAGITRIAIASNGQIAFVRNDGVWTQPAGSSWIQIDPRQALDVAVDGTRVAYADTTGGYVRAASGSTTFISASITNIAIASNTQMAFTRYAGTWYQPNSITAWSQIATYPANDVAVDGTDIALVNSEGGYLQQSGSSWTLISAGISRIAIGTAGS